MDRHSYRPISFFTRVTRLPYEGRRRDESRLLRSFVTVAEELHFGRAARRLHMTQPPLSMHIKRLEEALGVRLFERDRRQRRAHRRPPLPPRAGARAAGRTRALLRRGARIARGDAGALAIGYTPTATYEVVPPLLRAFRRHAPDVRLELLELRSSAQGRRAAAPSSPRRPSAPPRRRPRRRGLRARPSRRRARVGACVQPCARARARRDRRGAGDRLQDRDARPRRGQRRDLARLRVDDAARARRIRLP